MKTFLSLALFLSLTAIAKDTDMVCSQKQLAFLSDSKYVPVLSNGGKYYYDKSTVKINTKNKTIRVAVVHPYTNKDKMYAMYPGQAFDNTIYLITYAHEPKHTATQHIVKRELFLDCNREPLDDDSGSEPLVDDSDSGEATHYLDNMPNSSEYTISNALLKAYKLK